MTPTAVLPPPDVVGHLMADIVGREIVAKRSAPLDLKAPTPKVYGLYRNDKTGDVGLCVMDYPLAAFSGGAMMIFPKDVVNDAIKGNFSPGLLDAVQEILNVLAGVFHTASHITLQNYCLKRSELPMAAEAPLNVPLSRLDVEVQVAGYGSGKMTLLVGHERRDSLRDHEPGPRCSTIR